MKKRIDQIFSTIAIIVLPFVLSILFNLDPNSKIMQLNWQEVTFDQPSQNEKWTNAAQLILRQQPWQSDLWVRLAKKQFTDHQFSQTIQSLNNASSSEPLKFDELIMLGQAYLNSDQSEKAYSIWQGLVNYPNLTSDNYYQLVQTQQTNSDWYGAFQTLLHWQHAEPENREMLYNLALSQLIFDPQNAGDTFALIEDKKLKSVDIVIPKITENENFIYKIVLAGNYLASIDEWNYATAAYGYVTRLDPEYAEGWAYYGNALLRTGKSGYFALEKAVRLSPQSKIARAYLAAYERSQDNFDQSLSIYQNLSKEDPDNIVWLQELGQTYVMAGDLEQALKYFVLATESEPENIECWLALAKFSGNYKYEIQSIGLIAARKALSIDEKNWEANDVMGWLLIILEDYSSAERFLTKAYESNPESDLVNLHLGQLFILVDKKELGNYFLSRSIEFTDDQEIKRLATRFLQP